MPEPVYVQVHVKHHTVQSTARTQSWWSWLFLYTHLPSQHQAVPGLQSLWYEDNPYIYICTSISGLHHRYETNQHPHVHPVSQQGQGHAPMHQKCWIWGLQRQPGVQEKAKMWIVQGMQLVTAAGVGAWAPLGHPDLLWQR